MLQTPDILRNNDDDDDDADLSYQEDQGGDEDQDKQFDTYIHLVMQVMQNRVKPSITCRYG